MDGQMFLALALMFCVNVVVAQVTESDRVLIASLHDQHRSSVQSANMMKMRYHPGVAIKAQAHADKCVFQHDTSVNRQVPELPGVSVGQNIAYSTGGKNWQFIIDSWASEKKSFTLGVGPTNGSVVGHYTQIMLWKTQAVGCGFRECPTFKLYVCNYAYGQFAWDMKYPWKEGVKCADCPKNCNNGFCDCDMKFCNSEQYIRDAKCNCTGWFDLLWWE
ncbi:hypothetical protein CHS0354_003196 [Potamilus streckersoni]|uniref:SCP domain-containing protein n=1 Tax=Potamilus streckersoni TaxID=2493646 RepID=A0AAE0SJX8_9BIVA|nr:hypothetical protein CHS0354_003196 [Potamilus streckersoni]